MAADDDEESMGLTKRTQQQDAEAQRRRKESDDRQEKQERMERMKQPRQPVAAQRVEGVIQDPQAYGKARAKQAYFSDAGKPITPGKTGNDRFQTKFKGGKFKGLTLDQANEKFEMMWMKADPAIREKYAKMGDPAAGLTESEKVSQLKAQQAKNPVPVPQANAANAAKPGDDFEKLTEARPQKFNMDASGLAAGPDGKINAIGDGSTKDGVYVSPPGSVWGGINTMNDANRTQNARDAVASIDPQSRPAIAQTQAQGASRIQADSAKAAAEAEAKRQATLPDLRKQAGIAPVQAAPAPMTPIAGTSMVRGGTPQRSADIAAAGGDMSKLSTDNRMFAQGNTNAGGAETVVKAPLGVQSNSATMQPVATPTAAPAAPVRSLDGQRADAAKLTRSSPLANRMAVFAPKQGEELQGMKNGVPQYGPKSAPVTATPSMLSEADAALSEQGIQKPTAPRALPFRGPASQPEAVTAPRAIVKPNMDVMKQHADAMTRQNAPGATGAYGAEANKIYNSADVNTRNAIGGQVALRAKGIDTPKPVAPLRPQFARR